MSAVAGKQQHIWLLLKNELFGESSLSLVGFVVAACFNSAALCNLYPNLYPQHMTMHIEI